MMTKTMAAAVLALALTAPAVAKTAARPAGTPTTAVKTLRAGIRRDKQDLSASWKEMRAKLKDLKGRETAELAKIRAEKSPRADKTKARAAVRAKYAALRKETHENRDGRKRLLDADMQAKRGQIQRMRRAS